ncbi:reverse transcriptase domain-containing protein [Tanacetum coccineum]
MIDQGVTTTLEARDADRNTNGDDSHNLGRGVRRIERTAYECTYTDFLKCHPLNFKGTEGVAGLSQWFKRMKSVFHISNCTVENQVKFATCTLHSVALTWWNTHVKTVGHDAAYSMTWKTLMKMMTGKYCPQNEIKKLEMEIWNPKVKKSDKLEKYVSGLPDMIHGSIVVSKPKIMQEAVEIATKLMDNKIRTLLNVRLSPRERKMIPIQHKTRDATSAIKSAIWTVTAGALQTPTMLTIRGALGRVRNPLAMNVEPRDTSRGIAQSLKTHNRGVSSWGNGKLSESVLGRPCRTNLDSSVG